MNTNIEGASNAIVATVGFYAGALAETTQQLQAVAQHARELEQQIVNLSQVNVKLQAEEAAARRVIEAAHVYAAWLQPSDLPENGMEMALDGLLKALKVYDGGS
jgi:hypothetical protein